MQTNGRKGLGAGGKDLDDVVACGWYVSGTYVLTGEDKLRSGDVVPRDPFNPLADRIGLGAWEVGFRYAELTFDSDDPVNFFDGNLSLMPSGGTTAENGAKALTLGVNWYFNERTHLMFNWTNYWYDNAFGTPFSCPALTCTARTFAVATTPPERSSPACRSGSKQGHRSCRPRGPPRFPGGPFIIIPQ